jgi:hypothetical protein
MASLEEGPCEAGIFALLPGGWAIVERREFADAGSALQWMRRRTSTLTRKNPLQRIRGSIAPLKGWYTLDRVLAEYEQKQKAGNSEFNEVETSVFMVNDKVTASYTARQGQFLAFIYYYTKLNGQPPAEADIQRHFCVSPPAVHEMILTLEKKGLIARTPGAARSIRVLLPREQLPDLE